MPEYKTLRLSDVEVDYSIQPRVNGLNQDHVDELEAAYRDENAAIEPPVAWQLPDESYKLSQGFHRVEGAKRAGRESLKFVVRTGTADECAIDAACSNHGHGLKRTDADKRRAVESLLKLMPKSSDRDIAERCKVDHKTVGKVRKESESTGEIPSSTTRTGKDGKDRPSSNPKPSKPKPPENKPSAAPTPPAPAPSASGPPQPQEQQATPQKPDPAPEPEASEPADELDALLKQVLKLVKKNKAIAKPAAEELLTLADEVSLFVPPLKRGESRPIYPKVPFGHFYLNGTYSGPILKASDVGGEVVIDAYGHPVKPGLGDDFADPRYLNVALLLRHGLDAFDAADKVYSKLSALPKGVRTFPTDEWNKIIAGVRAVSNGMLKWTNEACPFCICRKCFGKGCEDCSGTGYWGKATAALYPTLTQDIRPKSTKAGGAA